MKSGNRNMALSNMIMACMFILLCLAASTHFLYQFGANTTTPLGGDFYMRWKECAYFLKGIDPFRVIGGEYFDPSIGQISASGGTVPWSYVLGNIINPGFLPYFYARLYGYFLFLLLPFLASYLLDRYLKKQYPTISTLYRFLASSLVFFASQWAYALRHGNQAGIVCCLLIMVVCLVEEYPLLAGILLGIAMVKPQIAAPFFLLFLLKKKYSAALISILIVLLSWIISFSVTQTKPLEMTIRMLTQGVSYTNTYTYYGIFDFLVNWGFPSSFVLVADMLLAAFYLFVCYCILKKHNLQTDILFASACLSIASTFWFYKQIYDLIILVIPAVLLFLLYCSKKQKIIDGILLQLGELLLLGNLFSPILSRVLQTLTKIPHTYFVSYTKGLESVLFIGISFYFCKHSASIVTLQAKP